MMLKCPVSYCHAPDSACDMGLAYQNCPNWKKTAKESPKEAAKLEAGNRLPWTGNTFGEADLRFVTGGAQTQMIGVVGAFNAGKTTLLTTLYILMGHGYAPANTTFAGSYTLGGWENLAHHLRHEKGSPPTFPPHTTSNQGRRPGLLHFALRYDDTGEDANQNINTPLRDVLLTDAPGEWFERWAVDKNTSQAAGARWIAERADTFVLVADSQALAGPERGLARSSLRQLAQRLSVETQGRPVALVWSKADVPMDPQSKIILSQEIAGLFPIFRVFEVSVKSTNPKSDDEGQHSEEVTKTQATIDKEDAPTWMELLQWLMQRSVTSPFEPATFNVPSSIRASHLDVFLKYGGI